MRPTVDDTSARRAVPRVVLFALVRIAAALMATVSAASVRPAPTPPAVAILAFAPLVLLSAGIVVRARSRRSTAVLGVVTTGIDVAYFVVATAASGTADFAGWVAVLALVEGPVYGGRRGALLTALPVAVAVVAWPGDVPPAAGLLLVALISGTTTGVSGAVRRAQTAAAMAQEQFELAFQHAGVPIALVDPLGAIVAGNPALAALLDVPVGELPGVDLVGMSGAGVRSTVRAAFASLSQGEGTRFEVRLGTRRGERHVTLSIAALHGGALTPRYVVHLDDVTDQRVAEQRLARAAEHDALTGLRNRYAFLAALEVELARTNCGVLFVDLDGFKAVNDQFGHEAGDHLLVEIARRLTSVVRPNDLIARFGGDEFVVLVRGPDADHAAPGVARRLIAAVGQPIDFRGKSMSVGATVGLARGERGEAPGDVVKSADLAMYAAKSQGGGRVVRFHPSMRAEITRRLSLESELREAVADGALRVAYQPSIELATGAAVGFEALARWPHTTRGDVPPVEFVEVAEQGELIAALGAAVLDRALADLPSIDPTGSCTLAVNVSPRQLTSPVFVSLVEQALARHGVRPARLRIEVTESAQLEDEGAVATTLRALRRLGVSVAIDDFGTGHASLSYLARLPVDVVKIDRLFVSGLGTARESVPIVASVIAMAHALGLTVVAEGVETTEQLAWLQQLGCDEAQGFLFGHAVAADELVLPLPLPHPRAPGSAGTHAAVLAQPGRAGPPASASENRYRRLVDLAREVTGARNLDEILHCSLRAMRTLLDFSGGSIQLVGSDGRIRLAAADPAPTAAALAASIPVGDGIAGNVVATGEPAYLPDIAADARVTEQRRSRSASHGVRSYYGVPLVAAGGVVGLLQVDSTRVDAFDADDRAVLLAFAPVVAAAVSDVARDRAAAAVAEPDARTPLAAGHGGVPRVPAARSGGT